MKVGNAQGSGQYHIQAEINMIPLIDVALVLLIIFMVISPILVKSQLNVNLPKVTSNTKSADEEAIKIEIDTQGQLSYRGTLVTRSGLREFLKAELPPGHKAAVLILADKDVPFDHVVYVMDLAKQFNVQKLGVSVIPEISQ